MLKHLPQKKVRFPWFKPASHDQLYSRGIMRIVNEGRMTMGKECYQLEDKLKKILKVKHVVLTTSGTSALTMATIAMDVNHKTKVLCTNMTWIATVNPAQIMGAKIILADTEKGSQRVSFAEINKCIKKFKPELVYLVHLNGEPTYNEEFNKLKKLYGFSVIEDAAQSFFVKTKDNKFCGTKYEIGCFSLSISKLVHMVYGGFCTTDSDKLASKLVSIRNNGVRGLPEFADMELASSYGLNLKPSDIHAKLGLINLHNINKKINVVSNIYKTYIKNLKNRSIKILRTEDKNALPIYILAIPQSRKKFIKFCSKNGIGLHYNIRALHETKLFEKNGNFINSTRQSKNIIRLPSGPGYSLNDIKKIIKILNQFKGAKAKKVNVGIIGGGHVSQILYIPSILKNKFCELVSISDERESIRNYLEKKYNNVEILDNYKDIIKNNEIEVVFVIMPMKTQSKISYDCLRYKKNVFSEKPMAFSLSHAKKLNFLKRKLKLNYSIGFVKRFDPIVNFAKKYIKNVMSNKKHGNLKKITFYNYTFKTSLKRPKHKKPKESRKQRLEEWSTKSKYLKNSNTIDWIYNNISHNINLINYFFDISKVKIKNTIINSNNIFLGLKHLSIPVYLKANKAHHKDWREGVDFVFDKGVINLSVPFVFSKKNSIFTYKAENKNEIVNLCKVQKFKNVHKEQINHFIKNVYFNKKYSENSTDIIEKEIQFIEKFLIHNKNSANRHTNNKI